jgi:hypothetical protein
MLLAILSITDHILEACAKDLRLPACLSAAQLFVERGCLLEADSVVLVVVGVSDPAAIGLCLSLGAEPNELARVVFDGGRVGDDLGCILKVDDTQFKGVPCADASCVSSNG